MEERRAYHRHDNQYAQATVPARRAHTPDCYLDPIMFRHGRIPRLWSLWGRRSAVRVEGGVFGAEEDEVGWGRWE